MSNFREDDMDKTRQTDKNKRAHPMLPLYVECVYTVIVLFENPTGYIIRNI